MPHVRICGGGDERSSFLLRLAAELVSGREYTVLTACRTRGRSKEKSDFRPPATESRRGSPESGASGGG